MNNLIKQRRKDFLRFMSYFLLTSVLGVILMLLNWRLNEMGILIGLVIFISFILGLLVDRKYYIWGIFLGIFIPLSELIPFLSHHSYKIIEQNKAILYTPSLNNVLGSLISYIFVFAGIYFAVVLKNLIKQSRVVNKV